MTMTVTVTMTMTMTMIMTITMTIADKLVLLHIESLTLIVFSPGGEGLCCVDLIISWFVIMRCGCLTGGFSLSLPSFLVCIVCIMFSKSRHTEQWPYTETFFSSQIQLGFASRL